MYIFYQVNIYIDLYYFLLKNIRDLEIKFFIELYKFNLYRYLWWYF